MTHYLHCELHRHATALRGLARDLLRDSHAADDVTQATLHQALRRPDLEAGPLGGWLQRTLVNFVRQWRRGERRRIAREASLPRRDPAPDPAEQLARRETLQTITTAVLALDEPYQTAVFLRYFEDLPPRAIAQRTATNVATVKSRLARGLAMLRTRLDADAGSRRRWVNALTTSFGLSAGAVLLPLSTGTLLVSSTTKILFAASVLVVGGLFAYGLRPDPTPVDLATGASNDAPAATPATATVPGEVDATERVATADVVETEPWLEHPFEQTLEVRVVDDAGLPVEGHTLQLAPAGSPWSRAAAATGPDGRVVLTWRTRQSQLLLELREPRGTLRRISLQHGSRASLTLLGHANDARSVSFTTSLKERSVHAVGVPVLDRLPLVEKLYTANVSHGSSDLTMGLGLHPHAMFVDASAHVARPVEPQAGEELRISLGRFEVATQKLGLSITSFDEKAQPPPSSTAITGTVFDELGAPAKKTLVVLLGSGPQPLQRVATDDEGRFRFDNVVPGEFVVRAGGDAAGLGTTPAIVTRDTTQVTVQLRCERRVVGKVHDAAGAAVAKASVEWRSLDGTWCDATTTRADGSFVLANLPAGPGSVSVLPPKPVHRLPLAVAPAVLPDTGELLLTMPADVGKLQFEPLSADGRALPTMARLWHTETGIGTTVRKPDEGTIWSLGNVTAGVYSLELFTEFAGKVQRERVWIDGKLPADLGRIDMPRPGTVRLAVPAGDLPIAEQRAFEISSLRRDLDLRMLASELPLDLPIELPAGDYTFAWKHANGTVHFARFSVQSDRETIVTGGT